MLNKSYVIILTGLLSILISSAMLYFDLPSFIPYAILVAGFILVGAGIIFGFIKMVSDN
jgi:hypothetical protein